MCRELASENSSSLDRSNLHNESHEPHHNPALAISCYCTGWLVDSLCPLREAARQNIAQPRANYIDVAAAADQNFASPIWHDQGRGKERNQEHGEWNGEHKARRFLYELQFKPQRAVLTPSILRVISAGALPRMTFKSSFHFLHRCFSLANSKTPIACPCLLTFPDCHQTNFITWLVPHTKNGNHSSVSDCSQKRKSQA